MKRWNRCTLVFAAALAPLTAWTQSAPASEHLICGVVHQLKGTKFSLETRAGKSLPVDFADAVKAERGLALSEGLAVAAEGSVDKAGVLHAERLRRIKSARGMWPEDR